MSDRISKSTIARIAGNLMSNSSEWLTGGAGREQAVASAVTTARMIAREVERTEALPPIGSTR